MIDFRPRSLVVRASSPSSVDHGWAKEALSPGTWNRRCRPARERGLIAQHNDLMTTVQKSGNAQEPQAQAQSRFD